jgi:transposase
MDRESLEKLDKSELIALIVALSEQNAALSARVAALEARLNIPPKTPDNSSLPPSAGQKANRPEAPKPPRKGRPGVTRALCPDPDHVREVYAKACNGCGTRLSQADQPDITAYDHIDLPPIKPVTTRVHLHRGACPCCGKRVVATPPADMPAGSPFGPGIVALVVYLHACQLVSYNRLVEMLHGLFGLKLSEGAIANMLARAASPFAVAGEAIAAQVRAAPVIASDETSARVCGQTQWQWVFGCATAVAHLITPSRGKAVVTSFLAGARPKVWISDRLAAQCGHAEQHQFCLAHLIRAAQYAVDAGDTVFAPGLKGLLKRACAIGRRRADLADATLLVYRRDLDRRLDKLLDLLPSGKAGIELGWIIAECRQNLFVFVTRRDVPATNNVSERALRPSVIFRKVTNGFRSAWGGQVYADIRSIVATGQINGRSALAAIRQALDAGTCAVARSGRMG